MTADTKEIRTNKMKGVPFKGETREQFEDFKIRILREAKQSGCIPFLISDMTKDVNGNPTPFLTDMEYARRQIWTTAATTATSTLPRPPPASPSTTLPTEVGETAATPRTLFTSFREPTSHELLMYQKDAEAGNALMASAENPGLRQRLNDKKTAHEMWLMLNVEFGSTHLVTDLGKLKKKLIQTTPRDYDKPEEFFSAIDLRNGNLGLIDNGKYRFDDIELTILMYESIPDKGDPKWEAFKVVHSPNLTTLTGLQFRELLKDSWDHFGNPCGSKKTGRDKDHALAFTSGKKGGSGKGYKGKGEFKGKGGGDTATKANKPKKFREDITCFNCDKVGHFASDCKEPKKEKQVQFAASVNSTSSKKQTKSSKKDYAFAIMSVEGVTPAGTLAPTVKQSSYDSFFDPASLSSSLPTPTIHAFYNQVSGKQASWGSVCDSQADDDDFVRSNISLGDGSLARYEMEEAESEWEAIEEAADNLADTNGYQDNEASEGYVAASNASAFVVVDSTVPIWIGNPLLAGIGASGPPDGSDHGDDSTSGDGWSPSISSESSDDTNVTLSELYTWEEAMLMSENKHSKPRSAKGMKFTDKRSEIEKLNTLHKEVQKQLAVTERLGNRPPDDLFMQVLKTRWLNRPDDAPLDLLTKYKVFCYLRDEESSMASSVNSYYALSGEMIQRNITEYHHTAMRTTMQEERARLAEGQICYPDPGQFWDHVVCDPRYNDLQACTTEAERQCAREYFRNQERAIQLAAEENWSGPYSFDGIRSNFFIPVRLMDGSELEYQQRAEAYFRTPANQRVVSNFPMRFNGGEEESSNEPSALVRGRAAEEESSSIPTEVTVALGHLDFAEQWEWFMNIRRREQYVHEQLMCDIRCSVQWIPEFDCVVVPIDYVAAVMAATDGHTNHTNKYLLDSGATQHVSSSDMGMSYLQACPLILTAANGEPMYTPVMGDLPLQTKTGIRLTLTGVPVVPTAPMNIISMSKLLDAGCEVAEFGPERVLLRCNPEDPTDVLEFLREEGSTLYFLEAFRRPESINAIDDESREEDRDDEDLNEEDDEGDDPADEAINKPPQRVEINQAHQILGHPGKNQLQQYATQFNWKLYGNLDQCAPCEKGKMTAKKTAKSTAVTALRPGERIFVDSSGPYDETQGKNKYWLMMVDDHTSRKWCHFTRYKSQMADVVMEELTSLRARNFPCLYLRLDNAPEWLPLEKYCKQWGIQMEYTAPYTPQWNGKVERAFPYLRDRAYAMMNGSRLRDESTVTNDKGVEVKQVPLKLWAHSVHTAVVLDNLLARGKYSNAYAAFKEHPLVRSTDLVPWGNQGWMKKPGKQKHFVSKAELVYFVGYADLHSSDTFLVWKPSTGRVIVTRNVKFAHPDHQQRIVNEGTTSDSDSDRSSDGHKEDSSDGDSLPQDAPPESSDDESVIQSGRDTAPRVNHLPLPLPPVNSRLQRELRKLDSDYNPSSVEEERRTRASVRQSEPVERDTVPSPIPTVPQVASVAAIASTSKAKRPPLPTNAKEAYLKENKLVWGPATFEEYDKFMKREAWVVEDRPKDRKLLRMKNVFTYKENAITRIYEARCRNVILGYNMREGINYNESFSPTPVDQTIRTHLTVSLFIRQEIEDRDGPEAAEANWRCCDVFDIDAAFLNTPVATDLWIEAPPLFEEYCKSRGIPFDPTKQCLRLANTQYGQVDASALWLKHFAKILHAAGMTRMKSDPCMFFKRSPDGTLLLLVTIYVDDAAVSGVPREVEELKRKVKEYVDIKDLGPIRKHLGIHYKLLRDKVGVYYECTMTTYKNDIISEFKRYTNQTTLKDVRTPAPGGSSLLKNEGEPIDSTGYRSFKGKVLFGDRKVWPDISNAVRDGCSHVNNPSEEAWKQLTRIMSYLEHHEQPLKLRTPNSLQSFAISDTDWATDKNDRRSTTSNLTLLGGNALVNWVSRKQKTVALSSTEAETYGMTDAVKDLVFQENLVSEILGFQAPGPMIAYCDNTGAIFLATNNQVSQRTKHIDIRHRFISELVESGKLELRYIKTDENPADILSKNCKEEIHLKHADAIYDGFAASPIQEDVANHVSLVESRMTPKMTSIEDDDDWTEVQSKERKANRRASYKCQEGQMLRVKALG